MPPRIEWDFGKIPANLYAVATVYEYARESESLRKRICAWLQAPYEGDTRANKLVQALKNNDGNKHGDIVWPAGSELLEATRHNSQLFTVITTCPLFPKPFLSCGLPAITKGGSAKLARMKLKFKKSRVFITPISQWKKPKWCSK